MGGDLHSGVSRSRGSPPEALAPPRPLPLSLDGVRPAACHVPCGAHGSGLKGKRPMDPMLPVARRPSRGKLLPAVAADLDLTFQVSFCQRRNAEVWNTLDVSVWLRGFTRRPAHTCTVSGRYIAFFEPHARGHGLIAVSFNRYCQRNLNSSPSPVRGCLGLHCLGQGLSFLPGGAVPCSGMRIDLESMPAAVPLFGRLASCHTFTEPHH